VTREEKAALRAEGRGRRRGADDNGDEAEAQPDEKPQRTERQSAKREPPKGVKGDELADLAS
jgi:hypothetical protein